jgi:hypothetical protein
VRADRTADALAVIEQETKRMAENGPTAEELAVAKSFLKGSYALTLDTSGKIAAQLTQIQIDNLGIDYVQRRSGLIDAITIEDAKKAARRLYGGGMLVTVAGRPKGLASSGTSWNSRRVVCFAPCARLRQITAWALQSIDNAREDNVGPHGVKADVLKAALTLDEESLGELMMHLMLETIIAAHLLGIDAFDQPAVEEGKVLAKKYLTS